MLPVYEWLIYIYNTHENLKDTNQAISAVMFEKTGVVDLSLPVVISVTLTKSAGLRKKLCASPRESAPFDEDERW